MKRLSLLIIMMATWMVAGCGTTDGTKKVGPELGYYENKKDIKGDSLIFSATSVWRCIVADKPWLDKSCDQVKNIMENKFHNVSSFCSFFVNKVPKRIVLAGLAEAS